MLVEALPVFYKQRDSRFYPSVCFAAQVGLGIPPCCTVPGRLPHSPCCAATLAAAQRAQVTAATGGSARQSRCFVAQVAVAVAAVVARCGCPMQTKRVDCVQCRWSSCACRSALLRAGPGRSWSTSWCGCSAGAVKLLDTAPSHCDAAVGSQFAPIFTDSAQCNSAPCRMCCAATGDEFGPLVLLLAYAVAPRRIICDR